MQITLLAQGVGKEIKGNCGHWVSVSSFNITKNLVCRGELEICHRLLQLVFIQKVFEKSTLRRDSIHRLTYLASVREQPAILPSPIQMLQKGVLPARHSHAAPREQGEGRGSAKTPEVPRGQSNALPELLPRGCGIEKQLFLHQDPFNSSHLKSYLDTSLIKRILFGSQEQLNLSAKPLGKGSVCGLILRSSHAAAQQSLISGNSSNVGYQVALSCLSSSLHEAAVINTAMQCEIVSLLSSPGSAFMSCKCN